MNILKHWLYSKKNNKKYKKQQFLKALKISYINRKKKKKNKYFFRYLKRIKLNNNIGVISNKNIFLHYNININWLLN